MIGSTSFSHTVQSSGRLWETDVEEKRQMLPRSKLRRLIRDFIGIIEYNKYITRFQLASVTRTCPNFSVGIQTPNKGTAEIHLPPQVGAIIGIRDLSPPHQAVLDSIQDLGLVFPLTDDWQTGIKTLTLFSHPKCKVLWTKLLDDTRELLEAA